jgi:2-polyprenyl-3-methyl-5-hydroxy-6-metoxy-1,4-benzoquinol methylase
MAMDPSATNSPACVICGSAHQISFRSAIGERTYCPACFHGHRRSIPDYSYTTTAMCSLGSDATRLSSQLEFLRPCLSAGATILEIGCATGELAALLHSHASLGGYEAIELSPAAEIAEKKVTKLHRQPLAQLQATGALRPQSFDLVIASHVIEHIADVQSEMAAMRAILKDDGSLFLEVPNGSGSDVLPFDDNASHIHFFSVNSLLHLLSVHGFQCVKAATGARLDARYSDSLRVLARPFRLPETAAGTALFARHALLEKHAKVIVWGAGSAATEILANFFDRDRILFFVDRDPAKQAKTCMGLPVFAPEEISRHPGQAILINSIDFAEIIRDDLRKICGNENRAILAIAELLEGSPPIR